MLIPLLVLDWECALWLQTCIRKCASFLHLLEHLNRNSFCLMAEAWNRDCKRLVLRSSESRLKGNPGGKPETGASSSNKTIEDKPEEIRDAEDAT